MGWPELMGLDALAVGSLMLECSTLDP